MSNSFALVHMGTQERGRERARERERERERETETETETETESKRTIFLFFINECNGISTIRFYIQPSGKTIN